jgi:hypothetical protein
MMLGSRSLSVTYANVKHVGYKLNKSVRAYTWVAAAAETLFRSQGSPWGIWLADRHWDRLCVTEAINAWHLPASFRKAFLRSWLRSNYLLSICGEK